MLKSSFRKWIFIPVVLLLLLISCFLLPVSAENKEYNIDNYDIYVKVNQNNVLDITETINADFFVAKHGIYRDIPVVVTPQWVIDGKDVTKKYNISLKNISVTDKTGEPINYETSRKDEELQIKIGSEDETFTGLKTYVIKYSYGIGSDGNNKFDELYYNLIGNEWDTSISNVTFKIEMPAPFDQSLLNFTSGAAGSVDSSVVTYNVVGNTITGEVNKTLNQGEGLTVRLELPDEYFTPDKPEIGMGIIITGVLLALFSVLLFFAFGRDSKVYSTVEVTPPEDITSAEAGLIIDGHVDNKDIISLIIYWADKGYISIYSDKADNFTLTKLKNADNAMRYYEKIMFNKLFEGRESVTSADLKYNFTDTLRVVKTEIIKAYNAPAKRLFTVSGNIAKFLCYCFGGICVGMILYKAAVSYTFDFTSGFVAGVIGFVCSVIASGVLGYCVDKSCGTSKAGLVFCIIVYIALFFGVAAIASIVSGLAAASYIVAAAAVVCGIFGSFAKKRTEQSNLLLGKLLGLKKFISMAEKSRIEMLVQENPSLFYNILPFAYVLGVTDKWAKKFENIAVSPPSWYSSEQNTMFNAIYFTMLLNHNMNAYQTDMAAVKQSSSSGFGGMGGGGFSGGGFGGGGGGSW